MQCNAEENTAKNVCNDRIGVQPNVKIVKLLIFLTVTHANPHQMCSFLASKIGYPTWTGLRVCVPICLFVCLSVVFLFE
jgi:hypothetical protein